MLVHAVNSNDLVRVLLEEVDFIKLTNDMADHLNQKIGETVILCGAIKSGHSSPCERCSKLILMVDGWREAIQRIAIVMDQQITDFLHENSDDPNCPVQV